MATALAGILKDKSLLKDKCIINGEWIGAARSFAVTNPVDGSTIGTVPRLGAKETADAIAAAERAMTGWAAKSAKERCNTMRAWYNLIMENQEDLAQIMTAEQGKPLAESRGEVAYGASFIEFFAEEAKRLYGETIPSPFPNSRIVVISQPVGVCAAITPWNFPNAMITRKAGPALAAGCAMVIKPASETPLSALALVDLAERAGIPRGILNVVTGPASEIGAELTGNPTVRMLTFTGSTEIGKLLMVQCAATVKKLGMELGGNFYEPTLITNVNSSMAVAREETFGPLAPLFRFKTEQEAIAMANDTEFGLACYFYSRDVGRIWRVGEALEYGLVGINEGIMSCEVAPFGGVKESGLGREGSRHGMDEFTELKYMLMGGLGA